MKLKAVPADFRVEERLRRVPRGGGHTLFAINKVGVTSLHVRDALARACGVPARLVAMPALKDRRAEAVQHATVPGEWPTELRGPGWLARGVGAVRRPLGPADLAGNGFRIVVRDLTRAEAARLAAALDGVARDGLPNVHDRQRYGSYAPGRGFIGEAVLRRDATAALRLYLCEDLLGDTAATRAFKAAARPAWPDWRTLFAMAPAPSNYRSVLTFLCDHPDAHRKALNLVPDRLLSVWLAAYQSWLWDRSLTLLLERAHHGRWRKVRSLPDLPPHALPLDPSPELVRRLGGLEMELPNARARWPEPEVQAAAQAALAEAALTTGDLKARIVKRAWLGRGRRALWVRPLELEVAEPLPDDRHPGRWSLAVSFVLGPGSYATWVLRAAAARGGLRSAA